MRPAPALAAGALATMLLAAGPAAADATPQQMALAAAGARACEAMPDTAAVAGQLKAAGFTGSFSNGFLKARTDPARKVSVGYTTEQHNRDGCAISASGMTAGQARLPMEGWLASAGARGGLVTGNPKVDGYWTGRFKGSPVEMFIIPSSDQTFFKGAAIVARAPK